MTINNFLKEEKKEYVPLYLSVLRKKAKTDGIKSEEIINKIVIEVMKEEAEKKAKEEAKEKDEKEKDSASVYETIRRYWYSCDENGNLRGEKCAPASFVKRVMKVMGVDKQEFWKLLKMNLLSLEVLGHTFLFTEGERANYEKPVSAAFLADDWYGKKDSARKTQFMLQLCEYPMIGDNDSEVIRELQKEKQIKECISLLPVDDCLFAVSCYDLYTNISENTENFIRTYLTLNHKSRKKLKESFEKKAVNGFYLLNTLGDIENMYQVSLLLQLRDRFLVNQEALTNGITQNDIMQNAKPEAFDEWVLAAVELYSQIDDDAYNLWLMYMLLDESSRKKKDREMEELKKQEG